MWCSRFSPSLTELTSSLAQSENILIFKLKIAVYNTFYTFKKKRRTQKRSVMPPYVNDQFPVKVMTNLNLMREQSRFCDVEIIVGDTTFNAHRAVLSAASAYFEAMFRPEMGLSENKQKSVILHGIAGEILKVILNFIYTGRCEITQVNAQELLAAANMLQLPEVVDGCSEFLYHELHPTNALGILCFAEAHNSEWLAKSARNFIQANFIAITNEDEFLETPQTLLAQLLTSELLRIDSESQVFQAALRWIKHDVTQRRCYVYDILSHVRLALVPVKVLDQAVKECSDMTVEVALRFICSDIASKRGQLVPLDVCPRQLTKKNIYIIGGRGPASSYLNTVTKFDILRREWSDTAPMRIEDNMSPGFAALNGKIYVIGGARRQSGNQVLASGEVYDPQNNVWSPIAPMITPRSFFGLCAMGGNLLAVGGWDDRGIVGTMECYYPEKDIWKMIGDLPEPRYRIYVVSFEGLLYIVGGSNKSHKILSDLISYNPVTGEWTTLASMPTARFRVGVVILDRYLYVVGGQNTDDLSRLRSMERYCFDDDKWVTVQSMSVSRSRPAVAAADGLIYVVGGEGDINTRHLFPANILTSVECYDPLSDTWKFFPNLPIGRYKAAAVVV